MTMHSIQTSKTPQRKSGLCPTCCRSERKGLLWLGGKDYVECPDCGGTGEFVMYEQRITPPTVFAVTRRS